MLRDHKQIARFYPQIKRLEKEIIEGLKELLGGRETIVKIRRKDADRNEFVGDANQAIDYLIEKEGGVYFGKMATNDDKQRRRNGI